MVNRRSLLAEHQDLSFFIHTIFLRILSNWPMLRFNWIGRKANQIRCYSAAMFFTWYTWYTQKMRKSCLVVWFVSLISIHWMMFFQWLLDISGWNQGSQIQPSAAGGRLLWALRRFRPSSSGCRPPCGRWRRRSCGWGACLGDGVEQVEIDLGFGWLEQIGLAWCSWFWVDTFEVVIWWLGWLVGSAEIDEIGSTCRDVLQDGAD